MDMVPLKLPARVSITAESGMQGIENRVRLLIGSVRDRKIMSIVLLIGNYVMCCFLSLNFRKKLIFF